MLKKDLMYSSGNLAASLSIALFSTFIMFFYVDVLKMPAHLIGIAMGIYGIWNAINDPLFGHISDRTRTRWGRRIPYILFGSVPFAVIFVLIWVPPVKLLAGNMTLMLAWFIAIIFLFDTFYTLVIINWTSLFPEMYTTQEDRTRVSVYRQLFGIAGNILGIALPPIVYSAIGWPAMGVVFGTITLVFLLVSLRGSREDPAYSVPEGLPLGAALRATFGNRSFLMYVIAAMFLQFTFVMLQAVLPFFAKYIIRIEGFKVSLVLGVIFIMAVLWVHFWGRLANRKGSKRVIIISTSLYGVSLVPLWFVTGFAGAMIAASLIGIGLAGLIVLLDVMLSDVIDEDELKTGTRREGMYFGINGFMVRIAISFQSVIMGMVLSRSGYNANLPVDSQPLGAIIGIKSLLVIVPIISLVFALAFYCMYPLADEKLDEVKARLRALHAGGEPRD